MCATVNIPLCNTHLMFKTPFEGICQFFCALKTKKYADETKLHQKTSATHDTPDTDIPASNANPEEACPPAPPKTKLPNSASVWFS